MAGGGAHHARVHAGSVPFPSASRTVGFPVKFADKHEFIEMGAFTIGLTPAMIPSLKGAAKAIQLEYGFKKGGIGCVYEMPAQPNLDPVAVYQTALKTGVFKDHAYFKAWSIKKVPDKSLLIAVSGTTPQVRDALIRAIGK